MKVLITGSQGALGKVIVDQFLKNNWEVTGTYFPKMVKEEEVPSKVNWIEVDLTDSKSVSKALNGLQFDALVHCAGGFRYSHLDEISDEDLEFLVNTNLKSTFLLLREILPGMKKQNFGRIVFISANATLKPGAGMGPYTASKAGLNMITQSLAEEVKTFNITVNSILPSIIDTPTNRKDMPNARHSDWVPPADLAEIIYSLVSPWGKSIHGALIPVVGRV